jgi:hypothetical protein
MDDAFRAWVFMSMRVSWDQTRGMASFFIQFLQNILYRAGQSHERR